MKKGKVEFHSQGQSGNIYYIIGAVRGVMQKQLLYHRGGAGRYAKTAQDRGI